MAKIPHPDRPGEVEEIDLAVLELMKCQVNGRWDLTALDRWLKHYPDAICRATERLDAWLDDLFPTVEVNSINEQQRTAV